MKERIMKGGELWNSLKHVNIHSNLYIHAIYFKRSMFCHHQKGGDCWLKNDFDDNNALSLLTFGQVCGCVGMTQSITLNLQFQCQSLCNFKLVVKKNPSYVKQLNYVGLLLFNVYLISKRLWSNLGQSGKSKSSCKFSFSELMYSSRLEGE